jgi:hypothetical protein
LIQGVVPASFPTVFALVGVVLSYATVAAGAPSTGPSAFDDICIAGGPACEGAVTANGEQPIYATPAQIDCPAPSGSLHPSGSPTAQADRAVDDGQQPVMGACNLPVLDFRYRVSRVPESERPSGAFQPQRARRTTRTASYTGLPSERGTQISTGLAQPAAIYAALELIPPPAEATRPGACLERATRVLEPLDRPPRA